MTKRILAKQKPSSAQPGPEALLEDLKKKKNKAGELLRGPSVGLRSRFLEDEKFFKEKKKVLDSK